MATETKRASGTITGGHDGTVLTVTMDDDYALVADAEIGRIVYLTGNNNAQGRYRRIIDNTTTTITIDAAFGGGPFRGLTPTVDEDNSVGDATAELAALASGQTFAISKTLAECSTSNVINITNSNAVMPTYRQAAGNNWIIPDGVVVYDEQVFFQMNQSVNRAERLDVQPGGALIFGRQNLGDVDDDTIVGYPSHGCYITDTSDNLSGGANSFGALHFNGGSFYGTETGSGTSERGLFYRWQNQSSFRMWGVNLQGRSGARVNGRYSVMYQNQIRGNTSDVGPFNPLSVAVFQDNVNVGSLYGLYSYPSSAGSSTVQAMSLADIGQGFPASDAPGVVFSNIESSSGSETTQIVDWSRTEIKNAFGLSQTNFITVDQKGSSTQLYQFRKNYKLDFTNADGSSPSDNASVVIRDIFDSDVSVTSDGGSVPQQTLTYYESEFSADSHIADTDDSSVTKYTDYTWVAKYRNHNLLSGTTDLDAPIGPLEQSFPRIEDGNITETDTAVVDAYTELGTAAELYDFADGFKYDNMTMPTLTTQLFTKSGTDIVVTKSNYDVTFDSSASSIITWTEADSEITVKTPAAGYTEGIECSTLTTDTEIRGKVNASTITFSQTLTSGQDIVNMDIAGTEVRGTMTLIAGTFVIRDANVSNLTINRASGQSSDVFIQLINCTGTPTRGDNVNLVTEIVLTVSDADDKISVYDITDDVYPTSANFGDKRVGTTEITVTNNGDTYTISTATGVDDQVTALGDTITKILVIASQEGRTSFFETVDMTEGTNATLTVATTSDSNYNGNASIPNTVEISTAVGVAAQGDTEDNKVVATSTGLLSIASATGNKVLLDLRADQAYRDVLAIANDSGTDVVFGVGLADSGFDANHFIWKTSTINQSIEMSVDNIENLNSEDNLFSVVTAATVTIDGTSTSEDLTVSRRDPADGVGADALSAALRGQTADIQEDLDDRYLTSETVGNLGLGVPAYDGANLVTTVTT